MANTNILYEFKDVCYIWCLGHCSDSNAVYLWSYSWKPNSGGQQGRGTLRYRRPPILRRHTRLPILWRLPWLWRLPIHYRLRQFPLLPLQQLPVIRLRRPLLLLSPSPSPSPSLVQLNVQKKEKTVRCILLSMTSI
jgi:hypothetical protein